MYTTNKDLRNAFQALQDEATILAGTPNDIAQRSAILYDIYQDASGNHSFPLVVLHGALWADRFLAHTPVLVAVLNLRYCRDEHRRAHSLSKLASFVETLKSINRQVFIDTYVLYYATKWFGRRVAMLGGLDPVFVAALVDMHEATRTGNKLSPADRRALYLRCLHHEQETMVAPRVERAVAEFDCPQLRRLCVRPPVRFAYFPRWKYFFFHSFSRKDERVNNAIAAYDLAERSGWTAVAHSVERYGVLPAAFFADPATYVAELKSCLLGPMRAALSQAAA